MKNKDIESVDVTSIDDARKKELLRMNRRTFVKMAGMTAGALALGNLRFIHPAYGSVQVTQIALLGSAIPQFADPLPHFAGARINGTVPVTVSMVNHTQQVLSTGTALPGGIV
ncbi:MAG: twin-arginine translocation signal domain-containing protein, partial [Candidatus Methanoperedens sp.]|nr:twin-arginine translocation signal domain-containing protein [Candidatus Methanoperedens sp.]